MPVIRIIADHREASAPAVSVLRTIADVDVSMGHLRAGDCLVDRRLLFERKRLTDLAESIKDGRLFRQVRALASCGTGASCSVASLDAENCDAARAADTLSSPMRGILIIEGTSADLARSAMSREGIQGSLIAVTVFFGVPILRSMSPDETARLMIYTARQARTFATGALPRRGRRPRGKRKMQLAILQELPGVGPERAERLLAAFGSVEQAMAAGAEELSCIPGIGTRTARAIRWAVSEDRTPYRGKNGDPAL
ncbi:nuclease [Candidatus Sumerlaeota bacterium]|nr:nuclease [Candidatus Sumerlaeota bacterium]